MSPFARDPGPPDYGASLCSPAELQASYARCRTLGVPVELDKPRKILPENLLGARRRANHLLLAAVERVIGPHHYAGPQKNDIYILCDLELVALKLFAAPEVLTAALEIGVKPGTTFTEESCGTNALALAREHKRLVAVRGEQHYCRLFKDWWCVAAPVKGPAGNILGYLDISLHAEKELVSTVALLHTLVGSIEEKFSRPGSGYPGQRTRLPCIPPEMVRRLSPRQREILQLLASGLTDEEIANECFISVNTVRTHRRNIYRRLGVENPRNFRRKIRNHPLKLKMPLEKYPCQQDKNTP
jgi:DNA-binding CsgD family transcriptional regulator